jgi:hypothetical protein
MIRQHFESAADPYRIAESAESKSVRGFYMGFTILTFAGLTFMALTGLMPV